jgi:hypothetical protein
VTDNYTVRSKLEFDMLNGGSDAANTGGYNGSWIPRMRQIWMEVDNLKSKWHVIAGQTYSLTVPGGNNVQANGDPSANLGWQLLPNTEGPPVPDDATIPGGLTSTRTEELRLVKDINSHAAFALSFENPVATWGGDHKAATAGTPVVSTASFSSTSLYNELNTMPDIVAKIGYDTPSHRAHFEAWGVLRQYKDVAAVPVGQLAPGAGKVYTGGGQVGGYIKIIPGKFDFQFAGGYGSFNSLLNNLLADVTYNSVGKPVPVYEKDLGVALIPHLTHNLDLYLYLGAERANSAGINTGATTALNYGYGNPFANGSALGSAVCTTKYTSLTGSCAQDNQTVWDGVFAVVYRVMNNPKFGHLDLLPQIQYDARYGFRDQLGNVAHTNNYAIDLVARYWPF